MESFFKVARIGLLSVAVLVSTMSTTAGAAAVQPPVIAIQNATTAVNTPVTLQWKPSLSSQNWQPLGTFSGSTNLSFLSLPSVFVRGICTNPSVSVTLTWPAGTNGAVAGYRIHYGTASGAYTNSIDVGNTTTATLSNLTAGTRYYFAATAYNSSGVESPYSNEANGAYQSRFALALSGFNRAGGITSFSVTQAATSAMAVPLPMTIITKKITAAISNPISLQFTTNLSSPNWQMLGTFSGTTNISFTNMPAVFIRGYCTNLTTAVTLGWLPSGDPSAVGYKLYYGTASHNYTGYVNAGASTTATVSNLIAGKTYYFAVTAYDSSGVQSSYSAEASGTLQAPFSLAIGTP